MESVGGRLLTNPDDGELDRMMTGRWSQVGGRGMRLEGGNSTGLEEEEEALELTSNLA